MTIIVATISALDLTDEINRQFQISLHRTETLWRLAASATNRSLQRQSSVRNDPGLTAEFRELMIEAAPVVAIAVCDRDGIVLNDADPVRIGQPFPELGGFRNLVVGSNWWQKTQLLYGDSSTLFTYSSDLESIHAPDLRLRLVVDPLVIREELSPSMKTHLVISFASIAGSILITLILSSIAFRPLGRLGSMLDLIAKGEVQLQPAPGNRQKADDFKIVESKVSLLGERIRGAQSESSDLRSTMERFLEELEDAMFIFGRDRRLIAAAGAVDKFISRPRAELIGQPLTEVFPAGTALGLLLAQAIQTARPIRNRQVPVSHADGSDKMEIALLSVEFLDASSSGIVIRLRDPEATRHIGRQLQTADRLSAISRLTGGVAHEVKNPLNAMLMHVELAKMKLSHGDYDLLPQMEVISSEILRLDRVVKTFLDFTRPVTLTLVQAPLSTIVTEIADLARPQAEAAGIELAVELTEESATVNVDSDLLKQALLNILVNAIEAMTEGGHLRIVSGVRANHAEIRISDTGPGIPEEVRDKIYNLYFTTKSQGSGIGLAMTFRIVQLHDGTINFSSEPGKGTTFVVELPLGTEAAA